MSFIHIMFFKSSLYAKEKKESKFWYNIYNLVTNKDECFTAASSKSPLHPHLADRTATFFLLDILTDLHTTWIHLFLEDISLCLKNLIVNISETNSNHNVFNESRDVNGFFGFAVASVLSNWDTKFEKLDKSDSDYNLVNTTIKTFQNVYRFIML